MALLAPESRTTGTLEAKDTGSSFDTNFDEMTPREDVLLSWPSRPRSKTWPTNPQADRHGRHSSEPAPGSPSRFIIKPQMLATSASAGGVVVAAAAYDFFLDTCLSVEWVLFHSRHLSHQ